MSLLEDVFLQDEAGEAQELERIIEGDEYDERPRSSSPDSNNNSEKEDEAEEDKRRVDPTSAKPQRVVRNPRVVLNPARLTGPRGIHVIPEHFKDFKFKGKGHEKDDLDMVLKKLEHWAYRLYPKFQFQDCLKKIETLGKKRPVQVQLTKIRTDQFVSEETVVQRDSSDDEAPSAPAEEDEFDKLLQQQIDIARATPAPASVKKPAVSTPAFDRLQSIPKPISSPSINDEQRERMLRNRQMAEERRLARLKQKSEEEKENATNIKTNEIPTIDMTNTNEAKEKDVIFNQIAEENTVTISKAKHNRSNVIDSDSSDEDNAPTVNTSISVDIHSYKPDYNDEITENNVNIEVTDTVINNSNSVEDTDEIMTENNEENKNITENKCTIAETDSNIVDISSTIAEKDKILTVNCTDMGNTAEVPHNSNKNMNDKQSEHNNFGMDDTVKENFNISKNNKGIIDKDLIEDDNSNFKEHDKSDLESNIVKEVTNLTKEVDNNAAVDSLEIQNRAEKDKVVDETNEEIEPSVNKDVNESGMDDIMEVDFSDDF